MSREAVLEVFQRYLPEKLRPSGGGNYATKCPFHKGGQERTPSFSVNPDKGVYHCFTCHEAGGILDLLHNLGVPRSRIDVELAGVKPFLEKNRNVQRVLRRNSFVHEDPFKTQLILPETLLGVYELLPLQLVNAGFHEDVLFKMEVGYDRLNNRITYPIRDMHGNLAGISGGVTPLTVRDAGTKYKVYQGGVTVNGKKYPGDFGEWFDEEYPGFRCENHHYLWNFHRVFQRIQSMSDPSAKVYIVEGFKAALWMIQNGYLNTVALMGSSISDLQQRMLHMLGCTVVLFLDNDDAGRKGTLRVGDLLWRPMYGRVEVAQYPEVDDKSQPDDYLGDSIHYVVQDTMPFHEHLDRSPLRAWFKGLREERKRRQRCR